MAKKNLGDVLTCDWNPVIGCERYSEGCKYCWYLDGIFPWQQRLGNIPLLVKSNDSWLFDNRLSSKNLSTKKGIVGVVQHGDLFWSGNSETTINSVLSVIDATPKKAKYLLWTKRAKRAIAYLVKRYSGTLPDYIGLAISIENQKTADERLVYINKLNGMIAVVAEPLLSPINIKPYIKDISWVITGSETSKCARPICIDWVRTIRDDVAEKIPFFIKQLGSSHKVQQRVLDGRTWNEFPDGWIK